MASTIVLVVSDTHAGSTTAIATPKFAQHTGRKDETQIVEASRTQQWIYACWKDLFEYAKQLAGIRGKTRRNRFVFCHLGDMIDGVHHGSVQLDNEIEDQQEMACNLMRPIVAASDMSFLTYGTCPAHAGEAARDEIRIANELGMRQDWDFSLDVDGIVFDLAHVGRAGQRDWTSAAAGLASEVAADYMSDDKKPPRFVLRGHVHKIDDSGVKVPYTRAIVLPSWQLRTAHGHKAAPNKKRADIGGLIIDTANPDYPIMTRMRYKAPGSWIHTETV